MSIKRDEIQKMIDVAVKKATDELRAEFETANATVVSQMAELKEENLVLKERIKTMEITAERNEQYNRKTSLILGGKEIPLPPTDHVETTAETRETAAKILKDKLKIKMQGPIVACHRLKKQKTDHSEVSGHGG